MSRIQTLMEIYHHMDTIYTALILLAAWAGIAGHLCDVLAEKHWKIIVPIYWSLIIAAYAAGILVVGLKF
jgi:hypothetical protein